MRCATFGRVGDLSGDIEDCLRTADLHCLGIDRRIVYVLRRVRLDLRHVKSSSTPTGTEKRPIHGRYDRRNSAAGIPFSPQLTSEMGWEGRRMRLQSQYQP